MSYWWDGGRAMGFHGGNLRALRRCCIGLLWLCAGFLFLACVIFFYSISLADPVPSTATTLMWYGIRFPKFFSQTTVGKKKDVSNDCYSIPMPSLPWLTLHHKKLNAALSVHHPLVRRHIHTQQQRYIGASRPVDSYDGYQDETGRVVSQVEVSNSLGSGCSPKFKANIVGTEFILKIHLELTLNNALLDLWRQSKGWPRSGEGSHLGILPLSRSVVRTNSPPTDVEKNETHLPLYHEGHGSRRSEGHSGRGSEGHSGRGSEWRAFLPARSSSSEQGLVSRGTMTRSQLRYVARGDAETEKFLTDRIGAKLAEIRKQARQTQKKNTGGIILEETDWEMEKMKKKKRKRKLPALYFPKHFGNEAIAYAFDVLIGFNRTPPAIVFPLRATFLIEQLSASEVPFGTSSALFRKCHVNYDKFLLDLKSRSNLLFFSSAIKYIPHVHESQLAMLALRIEQSTASWGWNFLLRGREMGTRCLYDYVLGNHDRPVANQFYMFGKSGDKVDESKRSGDKVEGTGERLFLYLDQNSLIYDPDQYSRHRRRDAISSIDLLVSRMRSTCKFYLQPVERLREIVEKSVLGSELARTFKRLNSHLQPVLEVYNVTVAQVMDGIPLLRYVDMRAEFALKVVDECIEEWGEEYVFCSD